MNDTDLLAEVSRSLSAARKSRRGRKFLNQFLRPAPDWAAANNAADFYAQSGRLLMEGEVKMAALIRTRPEQFKPGRGSDDCLIVYSLDENADPDEYLARLAQLSRAAGVHLVVSSERTNNSGMPPLMKANILGRIAFRVADWRDSRTVLDVKGAEKLHHPGELLYRPADSDDVVHGRGAFISEEDFLGAVENSVPNAPANEGTSARQSLATELPVNAAGEFESAVRSKKKKQTGKKTTRSSSPAPTAEPSREELIQACVDVVREERRGSMSLLQRRLRLGYTLAGEIMDELETMGVVGPSRGAEPREVLLPPEPDS